MTRLGWIRKLKDERATAVVEMALVLPILLLLSLGILDFGRAMNYKNDATQLANVAARYAAVNRNPSNPLTTLPDCATLKTWLETQADTPEMQTMLNNGTLTIGSSPDSSLYLDLLAVSVEAGMGFDGAVAKLVEQMNGPLIEEFELTLSEMRIGETRQDALKKMAERVGTPEISGFVRAIVQADQFGISLGRILRVQAADTRLRRQAAAEERAMKAPIKMLFPTVLFIFPAMFLVILGPAFINISKVL